MGNNILLECDSFSINLFKSWLQKEKHHLQFALYVLVKPGHFAQFKNELNDFEGIQVITYADIFNYQSENELDPNDYFSCIEYYLNDHITSRLLDRDGYWPSFGTGNQNAFHYHSEAAHNTLLFFKDHNFNFLYFRESPHISKEWLLAKCADFLDISIYISEQFVFTWLFTIKKGFGRNRDVVLDNLDTDAKDRLQKDLTNYVNLVSDKYEVAIPSYEKGRIGKGLFEFYNPFREPLDSIKRPHRFYNKTKNYLFYNKHAQTFDLKSIEYVVFFMHYQPERTSLPEGYEFSDQFFAIRILSMLLPEGVKLIVKEHPSMFTYESEPKFRTIYNYTSLLKLKNVELCDLSINSFQLIDNALAVSTITGTSAIEAYIRKRPVIVFGRNNLKVKGVHGFTDIDSLKAFVQEACNKKIIINNVVENLVDLCYKSTISGIPEDNTEEVDYYSYKKSFQEIAHYKLLTQLFQHIHD